MKTANQRAMHVSHLQVFFVMFFGTYALGQASPNLQMFASARGAAYKVYSIIDQVMALA